MLVLLLLALGVMLVTLLATITHLLLWGVLKQNQINIVIESLKIVSMLMQQLLCPSLAKKLQGMKMLKRP